MDLAREEWNTGGGSDEAREEDELCYDVLLRLPSLTEGLELWSSHWRAMQGEQQQKTPIGYRTEPASMTTEMTLIKSDTEWKGRAGVEVGCKAACRGSSKGRQARAA